MIGKRYVQEILTAHVVPLAEQLGHRLIWAVEHADWRIQQWKHVMFSDQSRFCLHFHDGRVLVKRLPSELFLDACVSEHDRYGGGSVMEWAGIMSKNGAQLLFVSRVP